MNLKPSRTVFRDHIQLWCYSVTVQCTAAAAAKSLQSCPALCEPIDGSPPSFPIPGILQARTLGWVAISFSNAWKWKVKVKLLSPVWLLATPWTAAYQAPPPKGCSRQEYWSDSFWYLAKLIQLCKIKKKKRVLEWGAIAFSGFAP